MGASMVRLVTVAGFDRNQCDSLAIRRFSSVEPDSSMVLVDCRNTCVDFGASSPSSRLVGHPDDVVVFVRRGLRRRIPQHGTLRVVARSR